MPDLNTRALSVGVVAVGVVLLGGRRARRRGGDPSVRARAGRVRHGRGQHPAGTERVSWTDWAGVRRELGSAVDARSSVDQLRAFLDDGYEADLTSRSALLQSAPVLQARFGFSPASAEWELFSQSREGAVITLRLPDETDFVDLGDRLEELGYLRPELRDWRVGGRSGPGLVHLHRTDPRARLPRSRRRGPPGPGLGPGGLPRDGGPVRHRRRRTRRRPRCRRGRPGEPLSAAVYSGTTPAELWPWAQADADDQARAAELTAAAGTVDPYLAFAMGVRSRRRRPRRHGGSRTTTRPARTPTAGPSSRPAQRWARGATSPTASPCARPERTDRWSRWSCGRPRASTCSAT